MSVSRALALVGASVILSLWCAAPVTAVTVFSLDVVEVVQLDNDSYRLQLYTSYDPEWQTWYMVSPAGRIDAASVLKQLSCDPNDLLGGGFGFPGDPSCYSENYDPNASERTASIYAADWRFETLPQTLYYYFDYAGPASALTFNYQADFYRGVMYSWEQYGDKFEWDGQQSFQGSFTAHLRQIAQTPEPCTFLLLAGGLSGLAIHRRRR